MAIYFGEEQIAADLQQDIDDLAAHTADLKARKALLTRRANKTAR